MVRGIDIRKLYQRWQRQGTHAVGLTARAIVRAAQYRGYRPHPEADEAIARKWRNAERETLQAGMPVVNVQVEPEPVPVVEPVPVYPVCCRRCCASYMRDGDDDDMLCSRCREGD